MNSMLGGFSGLRPVVKNLLILNVMMFVLMLITSRVGGIDLNGMLGLYYPKSEYFKPYQVVTHMFMHGSFWHIFMNMWALVLFGQVLEQVWGPKRFLIYYFVTGLGAAFLHELIQGIQYANLLPQLSPADLQAIMDIGPGRMFKPEYGEAISKMSAILNVPTIGASGAVFGLLLAFGMLFPNTPLMIMFIPIPIKAKYFVIGYGAIELYLAVTQPGSNIAHVAHLGGMIFGYIMIRYWRKTTKTLY
jgi:membrane associated rhomboid family serine protease